MKRGRAHFGWRSALPLLGIVLLFIVVMRLDREAMQSALRQVEGRSLLAAGGAFAFNIFVKGIRWHRMLQAQALGLPLTSSMPTFLVAVFYGSVTIGKIGEFWRADALVQRGTSIGRALSACLWDRLLDLGFLVMGATTLLVWLVDPTWGACVGVGMLCLLGIGAFIGRRTLVWARDRERTIAGGKSREDQGRKPLRRILRSQLHELMIGGGSLLRPAPLIEAWIWTIFGWVGHVGAVVILAQGLSVSAPPPVVVAAALAGALTTLVPVTFQGLGARELVFVVVLGPEGVTPEQAVVLALVAVAVMLATSIAFGSIGLVWTRGRVISPAP